MSHPLFIILQIRENAVDDTKRTKNLRSSKEHGIIEKEYKKESKRHDNSSFTKKEYLCNRYCTNDNIL